MQEIPRRARVDKWSEAELAIQMAVDEVEKIGADPKLTEAVMLLSQARERVADFIDQKKEA